MEKILEEIGLNKNEAKVYLCLLDSGLCPAKTMIQKLNLHRQLVYGALDALIEKGLASYIVQENKKYFKATDPKEFLEYLDRKQEKIEKNKSQFKKILPKLKKIEKGKQEKQEATIYRGNKGIKSLLDDMINERKEIWTIGASDMTAEAFQYHLQFNLPKFHKIREQKKIKYKILLSEDLRKRANILNKLKNSQAKILPKEFTSNSSTNIYGNKVSIILWGSQPLGILIKSKEIADAKRKHFNLLWKIAKR